MTADFQPARPGARPPAPAWMWGVFTLGPALVCALAASLRAGTTAGTAARDALAGLAVGLLLAGGLALSERFFAGRTAQVFGGLAFAALLAIGGAAIGFAGCIPYPHFVTVPPRRPAAVHPASTAARPGGSPAPAQPQPSPRRVFEVTTLPL